MDDKIYYAHTIDGHSEEKWQTIKSHAENVADLVKEFSVHWCTDEYAENLGLLHDIGKYQSDFQSRLKGNNKPVEHSICGAIEWLKMRFPESGAYCIVGHHGGLPDIGTGTDSSDEVTLLGRLKRKPDDYSYYENELILKNITVFPAKDAVCMNSKFFKKEYAFWTRMMYSCLTDADFLDTETFCNGRTERGVYSDFENCREQLLKYVSRFEADTPVKQARNSLRNQILSHTAEKADVYLINMPTGSGKTLTSMQFALERAVLEHKKHIIYVIPYTSIIEQNAKVFKDIFGSDAVLEHHCNFDYESVKDINMREKLRRSAENWDASIVVTTNVQFFQSIYGNRSSEMRKLHNIADSIIVFDEAHMFPSSFFQPCLEAIKILTQRYNCEAVFMTATMPDFNTWLQEFGCAGVKTIDLIEDKSVFPVFERCTIENLGVLPSDKLVKLAKEAQNALIVVNSRKTAKHIYKLLPGKKYHLSTYMTHDDRSATIERIKESFEKHEHFCLVSTSLIEAGVDLDFNLVFRELAGLDNLLQSAGRCNREGKNTGCKTYTFEFEEAELQTKSKEFEIRQSFCRNVFQKFSNVTSLQANFHYFNQLYDYTINDRNSMDFKKAILPVSYGIDGFGFNFKTYADDFRLIDDNTQPLIIITKHNRETVKTHIENLKFYGLKSMRKLQKYIISLRPYELDKLIQAGVVNSINGVYYLDSEQYYKSDTGICFENNDVCFW